MKIVFSEKLKQLRLNNNLSQSKLAKNIGITRQALSKYELGTAEPNLYTLIKIANYFNCSLDSLVFDSIMLDKNISNLDLNYFKSELNSIKKTNDLLALKITNLESSLKALATNKNIDSFKSLKEEFSNYISYDLIDLHEFKNKKEDIKYSNIPVLGSVSAGTPCYVFSDIIDSVPIPEHLLSSSKEYYILHTSGDSMNKLFDDGEPILVECTNSILNSDIAIVLVGNDEATVKKVEFNDNNITLIPLSTNPIHKPKTYNIKDVCIQGKVVCKLSDLFKPTFNK